MNARHLSQSTEALIFTDGASRGNPGPGGWGAVIVWKENNNEVIELGWMEKHTTNNQMELTAAIKALKHVSSSLTSTPHSLILYTDSSYLINGITKWIHGWRKNNWTTKDKKEVMNRSFWEKLAEVSEGKKIEWKYIGGHRGSPGNERCDEIATGLAAGKKVILYKGPLKKYKINVLDISTNTEKSNKRSKDRARSKAAAYSYVSMVQGKIKTHKTWPDCEKRVKGKSGARFKKALSSVEEGQIIKEWE